MKRGKRWFLILCLAVVVALGFSGELWAIDLFDGKLKVHGFLDNETGMRLKERTWNDKVIGLAPLPSSLSDVSARAEENKLSVMRSTLLLDGEYDITDSLRFGFIFRGYYDAKWDLDDSIGTANEFNGHPSGWDANDLRAWPDGEYLEEDVDLREYFLLWDLGNFKIKAGRQQIVWGEADAIRISDIINPLDYSKDYTTTAYGLNWEDVRIPQRMIDITYVVPESPQQFEVEAVLNPEDSRVNTYSPYGELYYGVPGELSLYPMRDVLMSFGLPDLGFTRTSMHDAVMRAIDDANPDSNSASFSGGMRVRAVLGGWDTHLFYYYQRAQIPSFTSTGNFGGGMPFPWDAFADDLGIRAHYPHQSTVGATFNYFHDTSGTVFRGEFGYTIDQPYTGERQGSFAPGLEWGGWFNDSVVYKDTIKYMLGFDRPTWISFLNRTNTFFITGQFIHTLILNYDDEVAGRDNKLLLTTVMGKDGHADHQTMFSLKVNTKYYDDRIKPDLLVVWDVNGHDGYVKPVLGWEPNYDWRVELGVLYFWADSYSCGPFGPVKDDDQIFGVVKWRF